MRLDGMYNLSETMLKWLREEHSVKSTDVSSEIHICTIIANNDNV